LEEVGGDVAADGEAGVGHHIVIIVGVNHHVERALGIDKRSNHPHGILHVNIIVSRTVDQQQLTTQQPGVVNRRIIVVSCRVVSRKTIVNLGVDRVVETPICDRRNRNRNRKNIGSMKNGIKRNKPAETPTVNTDSLLVDIRQRGKITRRGDLIPRFEMT
jgi:hypothetical protein